MDCECKGRNPNCLKCEGTGIRQGGIFDIDAKSVDVKASTQKRVSQNVNQKKVVQKRKKISYERKKSIKKEEDVKGKNITGTTLKLISIRSEIPVYKMIDVLVKSGFKRKNLNQASFVDNKSLAVLKKKFKKIK